jgi:hypothetical protein|tara:strand:+ start:2259 stop:2504 length:246 start_codon:yes stop_codon:yes gene_type:complete
MARAKDELAQDYKAMGHSVTLINNIIAGDSMGGDDYDDDERKDRVSRNVSHLELMIAKDDWGKEDMADAEKAVTAGNKYTK